MPVALINREGQTDWSAEADPWGNILAEESPKQMAQPLRLPGQQYDEESGLHYNRYRYYDHHRSVNAVIVPQIKEGEPP